MVLILRDKGLLRIADGRGATLRVLAGRIWISEEGCEHDRLLGPGGRYAVGGNGLVLVSMETDARAENEARLAFEAAGAATPPHRRFSKALQAVKQLVCLARR